MRSAGMRWVYVVESSASMIRGDKYFRQTHARENGVVNEVPDSWLVCMSGEEATACD